MAIYTFTTTRGQTLKINASSQEEANRRAKDTAAETGDSISGVSSPSTNDPTSSTSTNTGQPTTGTAANTSSGDARTSIYGYDQRSSDWEQPALTQVRGAGAAFEDSGVISKGFFDTISDDVIAFWVNAIAYGGYTIGDVLNDMKRREMMASGDQNKVAEARDLKLIDPELDKKKYQNTAEGQENYRKSAAIIPTFNFAGGFNPDILKYGANMPDELFKTLVPILDPKSQEYKDAVENVKLAYIDLANQQLQATSEQEKAVADYMYEEFKKEVEKQFGFALSDNADQAWNQIVELENTMSSRGIQGSGIGREAVDEALQAARKQDQRGRQEKLTKEEQKMAAHYTASATPAQIKALIDEDMAKGLSRDEWRATKWGLVPSQEILDMYDLETLKAKYPDKSEERLKELRNIVLDENGNYRSTIYSNYYRDLEKNLTEKETTAKAMVEQEAKDKEAAAYRVYDQSRPFGAATTGEQAQMEADAAKRPPSDEGGRLAASA